MSPQQNLLQRIHNRSSLALLVLFVMGVWGNLFIGVHRLDAYHLENLALHSEADHHHELGWHDHESSYSSEGDFHEVNNSHRHEGQRPHGHESDLRNTAKRNLSLHLPRQTWEVALIPPKAFTDPWIEPFNLPQINSLTFLRTIVLLN